MSTPIIVIKGKKFDAITGKAITEEKPKTVKAEVKATPKPAVKKTEATKKHTLKPSQTLMRSVVKKPTHTPIKVQAVLDTPKTPSTIVSHKISVKSTNHSRTERAKAAVRSENISRFGTPTAKTSLTKQYAHVPVKQAPEKPEETTEPTAPTPERTNSVDQMFLKAIENATHYADIKATSAKHLKKAKLHTANMALGVLALLVIAGFAAYTNMPSVQLKVAGIRAGVATTDPDFEKTGFAYRGVNAENDARIITLEAQGNTYRLVERATNWDSETMISSISSVGANGAPNYTVITAGEDKIYRFSESQATWVKNGIWYEIHGDAGLTDGQLLKVMRNS